MPVGWLSLPPASKLWQQKNVSRCCQMSYRGRVVHSRDWLLYSDPVTMHNDAEVCDTCTTYVRFLKPPSSTLNVALILDGTVKIHYITFQFCSTFHGSGFHTSQHYTISIFSQERNRLPNLLAPLVECMNDTPEIPVKPSPLSAGLRALVGIGHRSWKYHIVTLEMPSRRINH